MRIAQVAPLAERVPPKFYGGTERVVSWLTEELVALGHEVTLFASADDFSMSRAKSRIIRANSIAFRQKSAPRDTRGAFLLSAARSAAEALIISPRGPQLNRC
jgi:glycosyltransferase involved in cell wall biosynthesis